MAASSALWDLSGGSSANKNASVTQNQRASASGTGQVSETQTQTQSQSVNKQNTPQFALNALQQLIAQLSDRPTISNDQAFTQLPDPVARFNPSGNVTAAGNFGAWEWVDPLSGRVISEREALTLKTQRQQQRQQLQAQGGMTEGGTAETRRASADRQTEISRGRATQDQYSKEAAFTDAGNLSARFMRQLMETMLPQITQAQEASGTSGGAVAGLMAQDAAARVAEAQAALGLEAATQYGAINTQLAGVLEALTKNNTPVMDALIQALGISKGTIEVGSSGGTVTTSGSKSTSENKTQDTDLVQQLVNTLAPATQANTRASTRTTQGASSREVNAATFDRVSGGVNNLLSSFSF